MQFNRCLNNLILIFLIKCVCCRELDMKKDDTPFESEKAEYMQTLNSLKAEKDKNEFIKHLGGLAHVDISLNEYLEYLRTIIFYEEGHTKEPTIDLSRLQTVDSKHQALYNYFHARLQELNEQNGEKLTSLQKACALYHDYLLLIVNTYVYHENEAIRFLAKKKARNRRKEQTKMKAIRGLFAHVYHLVMVWSNEHGQLEEQMGTV